MPRLEVATRLWLANVTPTGVRPTRAVPGRTEAILSSLSIALRYRPLRIGWCVDLGDMDALRAAMRRSFTLWGGS